MDMKKRDGVTNVSKTEKIFISVCIGILILFFISIVILTFTRQLLVKRLGINNEFTKVIFAENEILNDGDSEGNLGKNKIDWERKYPFETEDDISRDTISEKDPTVLETYSMRIEETKNKINVYVSSFLMGYRIETELAKRYDVIIGWNIVNYNEYNGIVELPDGYLTSYVEKRDTDECAKSLINFKNFTQQQGADFLYIQAPYKIDEYQDKNISGFLDFSNQNCNELISKLSKSDVDVLDLRDVIHNEDLENHSLFYKTDHHWLTTTGMWGARKIMEYCNEKYGFNADTSLLDIEKFDQRIYKDWFLGSQGKKVTLARTEPDDFVLLYPKYDTSFHYVVPAEGIDEMSDYSIVYDMRRIGERDYYVKNPYSGCNYGDQPVLTIDNKKSLDDKKILIIHDSFGDCLISGLALCETRIDSLDIRHFTGSVRTYVRKANPDIVIILYNPNDIQDDIDWGSHQDLFDFR